MKLFSINCINEFTLYKIVLSEMPFHRIILRDLALFEITLYKITACEVGFS